MSKREKRARALALALTKLHGPVHVVALAGTDRRRADFAVWTASSVRRDQAVIYRPNPRRLKGFRLEAPARRYAEGRTAV